MAKLVDYSKPVRAVPKKKRTTWKDRHCICGKPVEWRAIYDITTCSDPKCWHAALRSVRLQSVSPAEEPK